MTNVPVQAIISSPSALAQPVAFSAPMAQAPAPAAPSRPTNPPTPSAKVDRRGLLCVFAAESEETVHAAVEQARLPFVQIKAITDQWDQGPAPG